MSQTRRKTYLAAVAFTSVFALISLCGAVESKAPGKYRALRDCLALQGKTGLDPVLSDAAARANELRDIRYVPSTNSVVLSVQGEPVVDVFSLDQGRHVVVDLYNTIDACVEPLLTSNSTAVLQIRNSLYALEPQFISRIVLDLSAPCRPTVQQDNKGLTLSLTPTRSNFDQPVSIRESAADLADQIARQQRRLDIALTTFDETNRRAQSLLADRELAARLVGGEPSANAAPLTSTAALRAELEAHQAQSTVALQLLAKQVSELKAQLESGAATTSSAKKKLTQLEKQFDSKKTQTTQVLAQITKRQTDLDQQHMVNVLAATITPSAPVASASQSIQKASVEPNQDNVLALARTLESVKAASPTLSQLTVSHAAMAASEVSGPEPVGNQAPSQVGALAQAAPEASPEIIEAATVAAAQEATTPPAPTAPEATATVPAPEPVKEAASTTSVEASPKRDAGTVTALPVQAEAASKAPEAPTGEMALPEVKTIGKRATTGVDPLDEPVTIDFYQMELANAVKLLAQKAQINVIAGTTISGTVTANIQNVPLRKAMETVLRMNDLGLIEEEGIWRIVPYDEALSANLVTKLIYLTNAQSDTVTKTLEPVIMAMPDGKSISVSANPATNVVIISGPSARVKQLEEMITSLDVAKPSLPTVTEAIKLNYVETKDLKPIVASMLTQGEKGGVGHVEEDEKGRNLIVTDLPVVIEQVRELIKKIDVPVKQVGIHGMIVDAVLGDNSQTGVDWMINAVRKQNARGQIIGSLQNLSMAGGLGNIGSGALDAGVVSFGVLTGKVDLKATIAAEVASRNAKILANPVVVTIENKPAEISIVQEYPYQEITQSTQGPPVATTAFKPIGVTMTVTPRITQDNDVIVDIKAKQSSVSGLTDTGVPIEDKREASSTLRAKNGQTVFIGGLRNVADRINVTKVPILGDIPIINAAFRNTITDKTNTELLIFITCDVAEDKLPDLSPAEQDEFDALGAAPAVPDSQRALFRSMVKPGEMRDPMWKWRRAK